MKKRFNNYITIGFSAVGILSCFLVTAAPGKALGCMSFVSPDGDFSCALSGKMRPEFFRGSRFNLLNANISADNAFYVRTTIDLTSVAAYGKQTYGENVISGKITTRNRGNWGNPDSIARTTCREIKVLDSVLGDHDHTIPRHVMWIREVWLDVDLGQLLSLGFHNKHRLTLGAFPFSLGRGIALGDAYAVGPDNLGFWSDSVVDQYAYGAKVTGNLAQDYLFYDLYASILSNRSTSFSETAKKTQGQEYGRRFCQARGFGKINYILAGRLVWHVLDKQRLEKLTVEPYVLFNDDREQRVQFLGDASSRLGTIGLAAEFISPQIECGFDTAVNIGRQSVKGWDRNSIRLENREGILAEANSHVLTAIPDGPKVIFEKGQAQKIIEASVQSQLENGKKIGQVTQSFLNQGPEVVELFNACNRFRDPYTNKLEGWMFIADIGKWIYKKDLFVALTAGYASGDDNPNEETKDGDYKGFIGLQELYSGKRVLSAFFMSGSGRIKRPLSEPASDQAPNSFSSDVSGFTNLVLLGAGARWEPQERCKKYVLNPNVLFYWQPHPTKMFNAFSADKKKRELPCNARSFLGTELNVFLDYYPLINLRVFFIGALFIPGGHYTDIRGKPLSSDQLKELDSLDVTGISTDLLPNIGHNTAITLNGGLEYKF